MEVGRGDTVYADSWPRHPGEHSRKGDKLSQAIDIKRLTPTGGAQTSPCTVQHMCHSQAPMHGCAMHRRETGVLLTPITSVSKSVGIVAAERVMVSRPWCCWPRNGKLLLERFSFERSGHRYNTHGYSRV